MSRLNRRDLVLQAAMLGVGASALAAAGVQAEATPEGEPIRIGASISTTGSNGVTGLYQQQAYLLWAAQKNASGGLLGRPVEMLVYDDASDPATGAEIYERLITEEGVDLVLGPYASSLTLAAAEVTEQHGYPMLTAGGSSREIWSAGRRNVFGVFSAAQDYFRDIILTIGAGQGYTTAAVIYEDAVFPRATGEGAVAHCAEAGIEVILEEAYPQRAEDVSDLLGRIRDLDPDMVICGSYLPDSILIMQQAKEVNLSPRLFAFSVGAALLEFREALGDDANYVTGPSMWEAEIDTPGNPEFVEAFVAMWGRAPSYHSANGYAACQVLEAAVTDNGDLDRDRLRETLLSLTMPTILPGEYRVDETGIQIGHIPLTVQWQEGEKVLVGPDDLKTGELILPTPAWDERGA